MRTTIEYWKKIGNNRSENVHDFISIHPHYETGFRLISPLCIVYANPNQGRPQWEQDRFNTIKKAYRAAKMIAALTEKEIGKKINVLFCPD